MSTRMDAFSMSENAKRPEIVVFAGPNGSGKSTITGAEWIKGVYINADDIQRERGITVEEAAKIADEMREKQLLSHADFTFETVLSSPHKLKFLREAKRCGYFIRGYFILTNDPALNVARVMARVATGLHDVPAETVIRRYHRSLANIPEYLSLCDICHIYDNTDDEPFRICRKHKNDINLYPNDNWSKEAITNLVFGQNGKTE